MILGVPWWVFVMIILIFLSGFMAFRGMLAEKKIEQQFIEKEGEVYMKRIQEEQKKKAQRKQTRETS
ncbi:MULTISPECIES: sporulation YhaL family protein [Virgibacillus]|uniref:SigE-dependent sporulation protein n=2 Tax=Virgibacillus TaxID=84406 RepID=A0A024QEN9_9BACI|nr:MULTISPECIES: sporulation YhaL family protein [Virgibacillus]EQB35115.1 hypothetical protein M948_18630 [Virgibacillus sp. CM-4]MYL42827.1 SigE-dependent sporulation protein [Virgibacillus massiliensis]GGJ69722.1 hypothetical protein GCM10007111_34310 [Virgibacillus kapii]CDQ40722.1 hypothetical protein BN990_03049 [Virgibacillus massiliensis]